MIGFLMLPPPIFPCDENETVGPNACVLLTWPPPSCWYFALLKRGTEPDRVSALLPTARLAGNSRRKAWHEMVFHSRTYFVRFDNIKVDIIGWR